MVAPMSHMVYTGSSGSVRKLFSLSLRFNFFDTTKNLAMNTLCNLFHVKIELYYVHAYVWSSLYIYFFILYIP